MAGQVEEFPFTTLTGKQITVCAQLIDTPADSVKQKWNVWWKGHTWLHEMNVTKEGAIRAFGRQCEAFDDQIVSE